MAPPIVWQPSAERVERAQIVHFSRWVEERTGLQLDAYDALWRWSVEDLEGFWSSIWEFFEVQGSTRPARALGRRAMPGAEWFPGARLSYAEHLGRGRADDEVAIRHASRAPSQRS